MTENHDQATADEALVARVDSYLTAYPLVTREIADDLRALIALAQRTAVSDDAVALRGYRAATHWIGADAWDGCSDCIEILQQAAYADLGRNMSPDEIATALRELRSRQGAGDIRAPIGPFQSRVAPWMTATFGPEISMDVVERGDRLLEEVLELMRSVDYDPARVLHLRDYVWGRPAGEPAQEVGGVMVALAAFCLAHGLDMHTAAETELARVWTKVDQIRAKQAAKPKHSPLPIVVPPPAPDTAPAGWRLVPIEPTGDMAISGCELSLLSRPDLEGEYVTRIWKDMVAAAAPPAPSAIAIDAQVTDAIVERFCGVYSDDWDNWRDTVVADELRVAVRAGLEAVWPATPKSEGLTDELVERATKAYYESNPLYDQSVDGDYRPICPAAPVSFDSLHKYDEGIYDSLIKDTRAALEAVWPLPLPPEAPRTQVDMRKVVEALGFEPDNHHNAAMCPYCNPKGLALTPPLPPLTQELVERALSAWLDDGDEWKMCLPEGFIKIYVRDMRAAAKILRGEA